MSRRLTFRWNGDTVEAELDLRPPRATLSRGEDRLQAEVHREESWIEIRRDGGVIRCAVARGPRAIWVAHRGRTYVLERVHREAARHGGTEDEREIRAPMTGRVLRVAAVASAPARQGELLVTIEAMKMEFRLTAPADGTIEEILCAEGDQVELGQLLLRLAPGPPAGPGDAAASAP
jgi:acetyl/propionyl-CoA carboxylase alpha subunit